MFDSEMLLRKRAFHAAMVAAIDSMLSSPPDDPRAKRRLADAERRRIDAERRGHATGAEAEALILAAIGSGLSKRQEIVDATHLRLTAYEGAIRRLQATKRIVKRGGKGDARYEIAAAVSPESC